MAFTEKKLPVSRQTYLTFFATGGSAANTNSTMVEALDYGQGFELDRIKLRLSAAHVSIVDYMVWISNHIGSYYNIALISHAMVGVRDVEFFPDKSIKLHPSDQIICSMIYSAANHYGLEISGWAITGG